MNALRGLFQGLVLGIFVFSICSCGGGNSTTPPPSGNPAPSVQSLSPSGAIAGSNGFTLTITGSNFLSSSTVSWNGSSRTATFVSSSQLTIPVMSSDLGASGTISVAVTNPTPGGGQSSASFTINAPAAPTLTSVSPNTLGAGTSAIALTVTGTGFVMNSVVQWNGSARPTTYVSNTQLAVSIPASDLTNPVSSLPISVITPSPGGGTSNTVSVAVVSPALPTITSLSPNQVALGSLAFTLTVNGTNFVGGANVYWNSISRVTQFVSTTQLTASILASDIVLPGTSNSASITVENPTPNAGISAPATLPLLNPAPTINSISPTSGVAGTPITVNISGSQFLSGFTVQFSAGNVLATTLNSSSSISVVLDANTVGAATFTVSNPSPSFGPSNAVTFTATAAGQGVQQTVASVDPSGTIIPMNGTGMIDSTGRYFAFFDSNDNLYLRDTCLGVASGCTPTSTASGNFSDPAIVPSFNPIWVSSDGEHVGFLINDIYPGGLGQTAEVVNTCLNTPSGCTPGTVTTDVQNISGEIYGTQNGAFMAQEGRYMSYITGATVSQPPTGAYIYDTCYVAPSGCTQTTLASPVSSNVNAVPIASADGQYLVYQNNSSQIILYDSCLGAAPGCSPTPTTVSNTSTACQSPSISPDAQYIAWSCTSSGNIVGTGYLCIRSSSGCSTTPSTFSSAVTGSSSLWVSDGGRFIAFQGLTNNEVTEIFVYDSCNGDTSGCTPQTVSVSLNSSGAAANTDCTLLGMSSNGQYVLFETQATNLITLPPGFPTNLAAGYIALNPIF